MDLVTRLRNIDPMDMTTEMDAAIYNECADEIERLQKELETERCLSFRNQVAGLEDRLAAMTKERDALAQTCEDQRKLYANCTRMAQELDELQRRIRDYKDSASGCPDVLVSRALLATLVPATELAACQRDAARYRWLREQPIGDIEDCWHSVPERFDAFIDQAMKGQTT